MESLLSIAGSLASIFGACWAFLEAQKSMRWASKAQQIHNEFIHRRRLTEVAHLHSESKRVLTVVGRVGPSCSDQQAKGVNCVDIAKEVEEYVALVLEQRAHFTEGIDNHADLLGDNLKDDIEGLANAKTVIAKKRFGKSIYYKIQSFIPVVKQRVDEKREQAKKD